MGCYTVLREMPSEVEAAVSGEDINNSGYEVAP